MLSDDRQEKELRIDEPSSESSTHALRGWPAGGGPATSAMDGALQPAGDDSEKSAPTYKMLRARLVKYFRQSGCNDPEDLADEVFSRLCTRLAEGVEIQAGLGQYCYGIARYLLKEERRRPRLTALSDIFTVGNMDSPHKLNRIEQSLLLRRCLVDLPDKDRELFTRYYFDDHAELAPEIGITTDNLRIRIFRIKQRVRSTVMSRPGPVQTPASVSTQPATDDLINTGSPMRAV